MNLLKRKARQYLKPCGFLLIIVFLLSAKVNASNNFDERCNAYQKTISKISLAGISNSRELMFRMCFSDRCGIALASPSGDKVRVYIPLDKKLSIASGSLAANGVAVVSIPEGKEETLRSQIAFFDFKKERLSIITRGDGYKTFPTLDVRRNELLYVAPSHKRSSGQTMFSSWNVYSLDLKTSQERKITNNDFFLLSSATYVDDYTLVFSGEAPGLVDGSHDKAVKYRKAVGENSATLYDTRSGVLQPLISSVKYSFMPKNLGDGKFAYISRAEKTSPFRYGISSFSSDRHQVLLEPGEGLVGLEVSPDGRFIAATQSRSDKPVEVFLIDTKKPGDHEIIVVNTNFSTCSFYSIE